MAAPSRRPARPPAAAGPAQRTAQLSRLLGTGLKATDQLLTDLGVSQATLSRTIQAEPAVRLFRLSGQRTPVYGLLRTLPGGVAAEQRLFRVRPDGQVQAAGELALLAGDASVLSATTTQAYEGLPPALRAAAPTGFLGRQAAQAAVERGLRAPAALRDWSDDHHAAYLFDVAVDTPGDLVFGDSALARELAARAVPALRPRETLAAYRRHAEGLEPLRAGSSAGGEQPKFLAHTQARGHVIVKYARAGTRWADLLALEHLALQALRQEGQAAATTRWLQTDEHVFLEVQRFDRIGAHGRRGVMSAGLIDDDRWGRRDHWNAFADRCLRDRLLHPQAVLPARVQAAFGELIGNSDRHFENLSLLLNEQGRPEAVAPAYDCLPMRYAPLGGGMDPPLVPLKPSLAGHSGDAAVWATAWRAARWFWGHVAADDGAPGLRLEQPWRELATANLQVGETFVKPLLGGGR